VTAPKAADVSRVQTAGRAAAGGATEVEFSVEPGETLLAVQRQQGLQVRRIAGSGVELESVLLEPDRERLQRQQRLDAILAGTAFAQPGTADAHPVMQQVRKP